MGLGHACRTMGSYHPAILRLAQDERVELRPLPYRLNVQDILMSLSALLRLNSAIVESGLRFRSAGWVHSLGDFDTLRYSIHSEPDVGRVGLKAVSRPVEQPKKETLSRIVDSSPSLWSGSELSVRYLVRPSKFPLPLPDGYCCRRCRWSRRWQCRIREAGPDRRWWPGRRLRHRPGGHRRWW